MLSDIIDDLLLCFPCMSSLVRGNSNAPRKTLPPRCCQCVYSLRTRPWEWLRLISQSVWLEAGQSNCLGPPFFPWLSYHRVLLLTPVFGHTREPQITCCPALLSPLHTNSSTLFVFLSLSLSLEPDDTHSCLLLQDLVL